MSASRAPCINDIDEWIVCTVVAPAAHEPLLAGNKISSQTICRACRFFSLFSSHPPLCCVAGYTLPSSCFSAAPTLFTVENLLHLFRTSSKFPSPRLWRVKLNKLGSMSELVNASKDWSSEYKLLRLRDIPSALSTSCVSHHSTPFV